MHTVFKKVLGDPQAKTVKRLRKRVKDVNALAPKYEKMSDKQLKEQTDVLKKRLKKDSLDAILPDAFAVVREAGKREAAEDQAWADHQQWLAERLAADEAAAREEHARWVAADRARAEPRLRPVRRSADPAARPRRAHPDPAPRHRAD